jgi:hypothetical protein
VVSSFTHQDRQNQADSKKKQNINHHHISRKNTTTQQNGAITLPNERTNSRNHSLSELGDI